MNSLLKALKMAPDQMVWLWTYSISASPYRWSSTLEKAHWKAPLLSRHLNVHWIQGHHENYTHHWLRTLHIVSKVMHIHRTMLLTILQIYTQAKLTPHNWVLISGSKFTKELINIFTSEAQELSIIEAPDNSPPLHIIVMPHNWESLSIPW